MSDTEIRLALGIVNMVLNVVAILLFVGFRERTTATNTALAQVAQRLDSASTTAFTAAHTLTASIESARMLALEDRLTLTRLEGAAQEAAGRAMDVADDLADAHRRADHAEGPHGAAADAAMRTKEDTP